MTPTVPPSLDVNSKLPQSDHSNLNSFPNTHQDQKSSDVIDLMPIFSAVWRKKWAILSLVFVVMLLTALVVMSIKPTYQAQATLLIEQKEGNVVSIEQVYDLGSSSNEYLQTQFGLLKSRLLAEQVVKNLQLVKHPEFDPAQQEPPLFDVMGWVRSLKLSEVMPGVIPESFDNPPELSEEEYANQVFENTVDGLMSRVSIAPVMKSQLVYIKVEMNDAKMAAKIANQVGKEYIDSQLDAAMAATVTASEWMNSRVEELKIKLEESEKQLQAFKESKGLIDVDGIVTVSAGELSAISQRLVDARSKRAEAESQYNQVKSIRRDDWKRLVTLPAVLSHPLVQQFKTEVAKAEGKVDELSKRYGRMHPEMQSARTELNSAQTSLQTQIQQIVAGIERQYQITRANERSLQESVNSNKAQIQKISQSEYQLKAYQREVDANRALFETFMTRLKETSATIDLDAANARIVDPAVVPRAPVKPKKALIVVVAGILAGMLGLFITLLLNALNNTFKTSEEVEQALNQPVLGILPVIKAKDRRSVAEQYINNRNPSFTESLKTIRTGLVLANIDNPYKIFVVTSSVPGEGKTTVSTNLTLSFGEMEKVLLIEADMRRPTLGKTFNLPIGAPGLANLIAGTSTFEDTIFTIDGIDLIPAGNVPPNPLELIMSDQFTTILNQLSNIYDRIIIDSAPVHAVSDSLILARHADALLYVAKYDATPKPAVQKGLGSLLQNNAPVKGVILNQVDIKKAMKQGYSYSGYYDYYGYSSTHKA